MKSQRSGILAVIGRVAARLFLAALASRTNAAGSAADAAPSNTPLWLNIDDFEQGLGRWRNDDAARMTVAVDSQTGNHYLHWTATDDGIGHIVFTNLERRAIDFSAYDLLQFRYRVSGKTIWNINPIVQQYPFMQGYRALYYALDTLDVALGEWRTFTLDLKLVENSWPDTFSPTRQEFQFEIDQLAGSGSTEFDLDDIRLLKNALGLERTYAGLWSRDRQGNQQYRFEVPVRSRAAAAHRITATAAAEAGEKCEIEIQPRAFEMAPNQTALLKVGVRIPAAQAQAARPYQGVMVWLALTVEDQPGLTLRSLLPCGVRPAAPRHPCLLCTPERAQWLRAHYRDPAARTNLNPAILRGVNQQTNALHYRAEYPPCANGGYGYTQCPVDKTNLVEVIMPNLPEATYQCRYCGRFYRGLFYEAAMKGWLQTHLANAAMARAAGIRYMLTGEVPYAAKAAEILRGYLDTYLRLPLGALTAAVHTQIPSSGATRIGGSYMQEKNWLTDLSLALDCIRDSGQLNANELEALRARVFVPSATAMMDHRVGLMNLQWMIDGAAVCAGLATEDAALVGRAVDGDHGIRALAERGFLADGLWGENPSYINVMAINAYPVLSALFGNGILPYTPEWDRRYKAMWLLAAPDGRFPTLGTGGPPGLGTFIEGVQSIAHLSRDPEIAWIDRQYPRPPLSQFQWAKGPPKKGAVQVIGELPTAAETLDGRVSAAAPRGKLTTLGAAVCYQYFLPANELEAPAPGPVVRYRRQDGSGMRLSMRAGAGGAALYRTLNPKWTMEGLMFRQQGADAAFMALFEPYGPGESPQAELKPEALFDAGTGAPASLRNAQAVVVNLGGQSVLIVANYGGKAVKTGTGRAIDGKKRVAVIGL